MSSSELGRGQRQALRREIREVERKFDDLLTAVSRGEEALQVFLRSVEGKTDFKKKGITALMVLCECTTENLQSLKSVELLLKYNADINIRDSVSMVNYLPHLLLTILRINFIRMEKRLFGGRLVLIVVMDIIFLFLLTV